MDPHYTRPAISLATLNVPDPHAIADDAWHSISDQLATFHCDRVRKMPLSSMDPSMLVGFLCEHEQDWLDLKTRIGTMPHRIFALEDRPPTYDDDDGDSALGMQSMSDDDDDGEESVGRQGEEDDWL